jgi:hypothetical protein
MAGLKMKYFVLKPEGNDIYAEASRMAMREYANIIAKANIEFATEIQEWVTAIDFEREQANELLPDVGVSEAVVCDCLCKHKGDDGRLHCKCGKSYVLA